MKQEDKVCSVKQSIELHLLGFKFQTYWKWITWKPKLGKQRNPSLAFKGQEWGTTSLPDVVYSALDVAELGVILPPYLQLEEDYFFSCVKDEDGLFTCRYNNYNEHGILNAPGLKTRTFHTEAQSKCDILLQLLNNLQLKPRNVIL